MILALDRGAVMARLLVRTPVVCLISVANPRRLHPIRTAGGLELRRSKPLWPIGRNLHAPKLDPVIDHRAESSFVQRLAPLQRAQPGFCMRLSDIVLECIVILQSTDEFLDTLRHERDPILILLVYMDDSRFAVWPAEAVIQAQHIVTA